MWNVSGQRLVLVSRKPKPHCKPLSYVTRSREMSHLSKISIFLHHFLNTLKCFILVQTPLQLDIWLQSYEGYDNAKHNMKQRHLKTVFANISKTSSPTSDSFFVIMLLVPIPALKMFQLIILFLEKKTRHEFYKS